MSERKQLEEQIFQAKAELEIATLQRDANQAIRETNASNMVDVVTQESTFVNPATPYFDTPGFNLGHHAANGNYLRQISPLDRRYGGFPPHFESESQWRMILAEVRYLSDTDEMAISAIDTLKNFTVHTGYSREIKPKEKVEVPEGLVELCEKILADVDQESKMCCKWERERFANKRVDGETLTQYERLAPGTWRLSVLPPDNLTEPSPGDARSIESFYGLPRCHWYYGVAVGMRDSEIYGYFFQWGGGRDDWSFLGADEVMHSKLNVPENVRRGLSDLFAPKDRLRRADKLADNTLVGSAKQAQIALIRKQSAKQGGAKRLGMTSKLTTDKGTVNERDWYHESADGSLIVDSTDNIEYQAGPLGNNNAAGYIDVGKDAIRIAMRRWNMPAWMATGDGDLVNRASSLTTEAPFTRATQGRQRDEADDRQEMYWRIIEYESQPGGVIWDRYRDYAREIRSYIDLIIEPPDTSAHDSLKDAQENEIYHRNGVLSRQGWQERAGIDTEIEAERIEAERDDDADRLEAATALVGDNLTKAASEGWEGYCGPESKEPASEVDA